MSRLNATARAVGGLLLTLGMGLPAYSGPGDLDVRFGRHGQALVPGQLDSTSLLVLPDGRILVFGLPESQGARDDGRIAVARLLVSGEPDSSFALGGHLDLKIGDDPNPIPVDSLLLNDGRILIAGRYADDTARGWITRIDPNGSMDANFGVAGVFRAIAGGIDRIDLFPDGAIAAAGMGQLLRLDSHGAPMMFSGSEKYVVSNLPFYPPSAMIVRQDSSTVIGGGFNGPFDGVYLTRVTSSGQPQDWTRHGVLFDLPSAFALDSDGNRILACGSTQGSLVVRRLMADGQPDFAFASSTNGLVHLGGDPGGPTYYFSPASCASILKYPGEQFLLIGQWHQHTEFGGGRILLGKINAFGSKDTSFDPSGRGREIALGAPDSRTNWQVADSTVAPDGSALLIARRNSGLDYGYEYNYRVDNALGEQPAIIARIEVTPSRSAGAVGFNDAAIRVAERLPADLNVYRTGGSAGAVSVRYELFGDTANEEDVASANGTLSWPDGDSAPRKIRLAPIDDSVIEGEEQFRVRLSAPSGGVDLGVPEIGVTIEDDEAIRALQVSPSERSIVEGQTVEVTIARPAPTSGPVLVWYAIAPDFDADAGRLRWGTPLARIEQIRQYGVLRWSSQDTSSRSVRIRTFGASGMQPDGSVFLAIVDSSEVLASGGGWKVERMLIIDDPALGTTPPPSPSPPIMPTPSVPSPSGGGGGSATAGDLLLLALALLVAIVERRRTMKRSSLAVVMAFAGVFAVHASGAMAGSSDHDTIVVDSANALRAALVPENEGRRIKLLRGEYFISEPLTVPDGVTLVGEGVMLGHGLPSGFEPGTETRLVAVSGFVGDLLSLGDGASLERLAIEYALGGVGNAVTAASRGVGDSVEASMVECEVTNPNASGITPQGPVGSTILLMTRNLNLGAFPLPEEDSRIVLRLKRSLIRSTAGGRAFFAINFASRGRLSLHLERNVVMGPLEGTAGVSRPDPVSGAQVEIHSARNVYAAPPLFITAAGWRFFGGSGAPIPGVITGDTTSNSLRMISILDRVEGFAIGISATAGRRFAPTNGLSSNNSVDMFLLGLTLRTADSVANSADFALQAAESLGEYLPGNDNRMRVLVRWTDGSGPRANRYADTLGPALPENLGVGNRIEFLGSLGAFQRSNDHIYPAPPAAMFPGGH